MLEPDESSGVIKDRGDPEFIHPREARFDGLDHRGGSVACSNGPIPVVCHNPGNHIRILQAFPEVVGSGFETDVQKSDDKRKKERPDSDGRASDTLARGVIERVDDFQECSEHNADEAYDEWD